MADKNLEAILQKVLALKQELKEAKASPQYQAVKIMERQARLKDLNEWRRKAHEFYRRYEVASPEVKQKIGELLK